MKPGSINFIGPLTAAQQRRRARSRNHFRLAAEIADARNISMREAFMVATAKGEPSYSWSPMRGDSYP